MLDEGVLQPILADLLARFQQAMQTGEAPSVERFAREGAGAVMAALALERSTPHHGAAPSLAGAATGQAKSGPVPQPRVRTVRDLRVERRVIRNAHRGRSFGARSDQMQRITSPAAWSNELKGLGVDPDSELTPG
jgi:hypothetical protein